MISSSSIKAQQERLLKVAIIESVESEISRAAVERLSKNLSSAEQLRVIDADQGRAAVSGMNYSGSLNFSLVEARDLGNAIGCNFFAIVKAQISRRSPSSGPIYFESFASIFLVSTWSGKLILWERLEFRDTTTAGSNRQLLQELSNASLRERHVQAIRETHNEERDKRQIIIDNTTPIIEEAPDDEASAEAQGIRLPRPYRRLVPSYPDTAARAEVEGIVDVLVDLDAQGEVTQIELARWAGYGLDEAAIATARQLHFFPASRDGVPIPMRILLRYNFRKPEKTR